ACRFPGETSDEESALPPGHHGDSIGARKIDEDRGARRRSGGLAPHVNAHIATPRAANKRQRSRAGQDARSEQCEKNAATCKVLESHLHFPSKVVLKEAVIFAELHA